MLLTYSRCLARNMPTVESCLRSSLKPLLTVGFMGAESSDAQQGLASVRCATKNWSLIFIHTLCGPVLEILCVSAHLVLKAIPRLLSDHPVCLGGNRCRPWLGCEEQRRVSLSIFISEKNTVEENGKDSIPHPDLAIFYALPCLLYLFFLNIYCHWIIWK